VETFIPVALFIAWSAICVAVGFKWGRVLGRG